MNDAKTISIRNFNKKLVNDERISISMVSFFFLSSGFYLFVLPTQRALPRSCFIFFLPFLLCIRYLSAMVWQYAARDNHRKKTTWESHCTWSKREVFEHKRIDEAEIYFRTGKQLFCSDYILTSTPVRRKLINLRGQHIHLLWSVFFFVLPAYWKIECFCDHFVLSLCFFDLIIKALGLGFG